MSDQCLTGEQRAALLALHEWDELVFGGFYCTHCTPDDPYSLDDPIWWPCQPLRTAGITDDEARELVIAYREKRAAEHAAEREARKQEAQSQADAFNAAHPIGTPVVAYPGARPEDIPSARRIVTATRSAASVLGGTAVVWVHGHGGCIALSHVDVRTEATPGEQAELRHLLYDADDDASTPAFPYPNARHLEAS